MPSTHTDVPIWQDAHAVRNAMAIGAAFAERAVTLAEAIARVPSPTGEESARAILVAELFRQNGIPDVSIDPIYDVVARHPGRSSAQCTLLAAHTDTVFHRDTELAVRRDGDTGYGPGLGDNSLGVASVILLPQMIEELGAQVATDLLLTGNVGEEGLGNLRGIKRVLDDHPAIGAVIAVEGQNLGRITHIAVGSLRLRVTVTGPGGHSWGDFGNPSAIHAAAQMIQSLAQIPLTQSPKTTLNVGMISGGISINSIAPTAVFDIDLRSTDPVSLKRLVDRVHAALTPREPRISVDVLTLGERPAGQVSINSPIVTTAAEVLRSINCSPSADASSTDANIAIARGIPAVCIGMTTGGNAHRLDEYIDIPPIATGLAQLLLLTLAVSSDLARGQLSLAR